MANKRFYKFIKVCYNVINLLFYFILKILDFLTLLIFFIEQQERLANKPVFFLFDEFNIEETNNTIINFHKLLGIK